MKVTTLVENLGRVGCFGAHGLSNWIETARHTILFDAGPDGPLLLRNAEMMGIDLRKADTAVLSHGHYDHAGGLLAFTAENSRALLYLQERALLPHRAAEKGGEREIGVVSELTKTAGNRLVAVEDALRMDEELTLFSDIRTEDYLPSSNRSLFEARDGELVPDDFRHEQNLLVTENGFTALFAGCAHRGIVNILRRAEEKLGRSPDAVIAGFHLTNPGQGTDEPEELVCRVGQELASRANTVYITGHCTGIEPYAALKRILGDRLRYMSVGTVFELN